MRILLTSLVFMIVQLSVQSQSLKDKVSTEEKIFGLSKIWSEITYNYAFMDKVTFDIDSLYKSLIPKALEAKDNETYIEVLTEFLRPFKNQKTYVSRHQWYWNEVDFPPLDIELIDSTYYVKRIDAKLSERIPINSKLMAVDGKEPTDYLVGPKLSAVAIEIVTPNGDTIQDALPRNRNFRYRNGNEHEMIPARTYDPFIKFEYRVQEDFSVVTLNTFSDSIVVDEFRSKINEINNTNGLVIDVTNNQGGNSENAKAIAIHLAEAEYIVGPSWKTRIHNSAKKAFGGSRHQGHETDPQVTENQDYFNNIAYEVNPPDTTIISNEIPKITVPIIILQSGRTVSAAEDFLIYLMGNQNITRVGQTSRGNSGQPLKFGLSNGVSISVIAKRDALPNGEDYIGIGIKPEIEIDIEIDQIDKAIRLLKDI